MMQIHSSIAVQSAVSQPWAGVLTQAPPSPANLKILIVNEDMGSADALKSTLQELGYAATFTAYSARRALVAAAEFSPDIIIIDLELPDMTGFQLARKFRSHLKRQVRQAPLLAVAEHLEPVDTARTQAAGFIGCLTKPVVQSELHSMLRRLRGQLV